MQCCPPNQWNEYNHALSKAGADLVHDIEKIRSTIHPIKISIFYPISRIRMNKLDSSYHNLLQNYELFFDASMRFLKSYLDKDYTHKDQAFSKEYVKALLQHSSQSIDYITTLVTKKSTEYKHCQTLFVALAAIIIALLPIGVRLFASLWHAITTLVTHNYTSQPRQ